MLRRPTTPGDLLLLLPHHESQSHNYEMVCLTLHLRSESKPLEHRSVLTPTVTRKLLDKGFKVNVERSPGRVFDDEEFASVGATLVEEGSWPSGPEGHIIIGLKELEDKDPFPLKASFKRSHGSQHLAKNQHTHIAFSHCYVRRFSRKLINPGS